MESTDTQDSAMTQPTPRPIGKPPNHRTTRIPPHVHVRSFPPELPASAWLRLDDVLQYVPMSRSAWFRGVANGQLPRPHKVGHLAFWKARDIRVLLDMGPRAPRRTRR